MLRRFCKNTTGMTLVEIVVSLVIASILITTAGGIYLMSNNLFSNYARHNDDKQVTDHIGQYVKDRVSFATTLEVSRSQKPMVRSNHTLKFSTDGKLYLDGVDVYGDGYYNGRQIICQIMPPDTEEKEKSQKEGNVVLEYNIQLQDEDGEELYTTKATVKLVNMSLKKKEIKYTDEEAEENAVIDSATRDLYLYYRTE